jgi:hypothetical protein
MVITSVQAQCNLDFSFSNTGTNMTAFFTPPAASSVYAELGDGIVGAFYTTEEGAYVCGASIVFTGAQIQLAVMADDATTTAKDGFSAGESIHWFYQTTNGNIYSLGLTPADNFVINGMSFISAASIEEVACGGDPSNGDDCPPLDTDFVNTGSNMTLFVTPAAASDLSALGNGTIAVYSGEADEQFCAGSAVFTGAQTQITAMADDATTDAKDGFSDGESIVWKFQDTDGNQYDLTPNPADGFSLNGISFVMGISYEAVSCAVDQEGCTDEAYLEYDSQATIDNGTCLDLAVYGCTGEAYLEYNSSANTDDGSCVTLIVEGCMDENYLEYVPSATIDNDSCLTLAVYGCTNDDYLEYNSSANTDDGSCVTLIVEGCMDENYLEYVPSATIDNDSCLTLAVYGCTNDDYLEYNSSANVDDGMCITLILEGCTDIVYVEYNAYANLDDGSCTTFIVEGCTDENATNFNTDANTNDGFCEYDLIPEGCQMSFETTNTGTNHTVMIPGLSTNVLSAGDLIGVFFIAADGSAACAGSSVWTGNNMQIVAYGDDMTTPELDGLPVGAPFLFLAQSGDDLFMVDASFESSGMASYAVNGLSFVSGLDFNHACTVEYLGCTDATALNYDSLANTDDGTCVPYVFGCTDENATNFNTDANTNDGSCEYDLIPEGCQMSFETTNTGTNHTVMIPGLSTNVLSAGDLIGVFFIAADGSAVCAGSSEWAGDNMQIIAYGDDMTTPEVDGLSVGAPFLFLARSGDNLFMVDASFESSDMASYAVNGLSFVSDLDFNHACTVEYLGCTDESACNYDATVNTDDGSCAYPDDFYNCSGSCTSDVDSDGVCDQLEIVGCMDVNAANYDANATDSGSCEYAGCTDENYLEYDPEATIADDSSCMTLIVVGCTDENATNFNTDANTNDGSCEYDLIPEDCQMSFETTNTGTNHTVMIPGLSTNVLSAGDLIGVFFIAEDGSAACAGSSVWTGGNMQIVAYGDDTTTPEVDGLSVGAPFIFLAQSGDDLLVVDASFESAGMASYAVNGLSFVSGLDFDHACTIEYLGCTDVSASNFDASATEEDGSCISWEEAYENCLTSGGDDGVTQADVDLVQDLLDAANYSLVISEDLIVNLEAELSAALANQGGVSQSELDAMMAELAASFAQIALLNDLIANLEADLSVTMENQEDGVTQADVDAVQTLLDAVNTELEVALASQEDGVSQVDVDIVQTLLDAVNTELETALANQEDGVSQADVDAVQVLLDAANAELESADGDKEECASQTDIDDVQVLLDAVNAELETALANQEDGVSQADVDDVQVLLDAVNADLETALANQEDGVFQADVDDVQVLLDAANIDITDLQTQLGEALASGGGGGSCEPIYVALLQGWNIIGYTLPNPQDVTATMASIVEHVQIVKNNAAAVYWPEYGFNGIGDYIPGQGYQIRMHNALSNFTFPDVGSQRVELTPTVPNWVYDLPVLNHPNDMRSLVKVVNMLGRQVNPDEQFKGEILLYLYSDGTTEKLMVD